MTDGSLEALPEIEPYAHGLSLESASRVLVFIGGFPDDHTQWAHQIAEFKDDYHIITLATPDFDRQSLRRRWGYTLQEILKMITRSINKHLGDSRAFDLVLHDWGCFWGYRYAKENSSRVRKLVAFDVGAPVGPDDKIYRGMAWMLPYQLTFAAVFWIGTRISPKLAELLFRFFIHVLSPWIGPMWRNFDWTRDMPRPLSEVKWWMCYPYLQTIMLLLKNPSIAKEGLMPTMPVLYGYGRQKRAFFHSSTFTDKLAETPGCKVVEYDCSHWMMYQKAKQVNEDMRAFLLPDNQ